MSWGMVAVAGASLVGGAMSADAAGDAADAQAAGTREANAIQREQYNQTRDDLAPYRGLGSNAANMLSYYLGMGGGGGGAMSAPSLSSIRSQLAQQNPYAGGGLGGNLPEAISIGRSDEGDEYVLTGDQRMQIPWFATMAKMAGSGQSFEDYNAELDRLAQQQYEQQQAEYSANLAALESAKADPRYGSLLKNFTGEDLQNEPGYQFGLNQGMQALDRRLASGGAYFSGAALKGAQRFGQDYAGTKFNEAYNRDSGNKTRTYNFLSGAVGTGQNAAAMTGNAGTNMANQVSMNTTANANAQGAARIAQGNAWSGGFQGAADAFQQNNLLKRITGGNSGWGNSGWGTGNAYGNQDYGQYF